MGGWACIMIDDGDWVLSQRASLAVLGALGFGCVCGGEAILDTHYFNGDRCTVI